MLTESEREWLKTRDKKRSYCVYCEATFGADSCYWKCVTESCAMYPDMKDAAEFSERVAAKLSELPEDVHPCPYGATNRCSYDDCGNPHLGCRRSILKYARLAVEEEMDADR